MSVRLAVRTYFSAQHLQAAAYFARQAIAIERTLAPASTAPPAHRGSVVAAVFLAVAFLEAEINELFADTCDQQWQQLEGLDEHTIELMAQMWKLGVSRTSILNKYAVALSLAGSTELEKDRAPWQPTSALVELRNSLVHYEPECIQADATKLPNEGTRLERALAGLFPRNGLTGVGNLLP